MPIPKTIYQTYKTSKLPFITKWHIYRLRKINPEYDYQFYDDQRIESFIKTEFDSTVYDLYKQIDIGAAKADFFRYAILYKKGGVYLDIDSKILKKLDSIIMPDDSAVISLESNMKCYVQYALFFDKGHPFLKRTLEVVIDNLQNNRNPYDIHSMTGPTAFTNAIKECLADSPETQYRQLDFDYNRMVQFSYPMSKTFLYGFSRKNHWKNQSKTKPILKGVERL